MSRTVFFPHFEFLSNMEPRLQWGQHVGTRHGNQHGTSQLRRFEHYVTCSFVALARHRARKPHKTRVDRMSADSPRLHEINSNIDMNVCEILGKGRGLIAGASCVPGDVLLYEWPYHAVVSTPDLSTTCSAKLTDLKQRGIRCKRCKHVRYVLASPYLFAVLLSPWAARRRSARLRSTRKRLAAPTHCSQPAPCASSVPYKNKLDATR